MAGVGDIVLYKNGAGQEYPAIIVALQYSGDCDLLTVFRPFETAGSVTARHESLPPTIPPFGGTWRERS